MAVMKSSYETLFKKLKLKLRDNIPGAALAYLVLASAYPPLLYDIKDKDTRLKKAAALGFLIYGTYAFTLYAILPVYSLKLALIETVWGAFLFATTTWLVDLINTFFPLLKM
jgi:uncharacterized membrane protein